MTDIVEHAEDQHGPEIVLMSDLPQREPGTIRLAELTDCNSITAEDEFPEHGVFLEIAVEDSLEYWECAGSLATEIVEEIENAEEIPGSQLDVVSVAKTPSGEWRCSVSIEQPTE